MALNPHLEAPRGGPGLGHLPLLEFFTQNNVRLLHPLPWKRMKSRKRRNVARAMTHCSLEALLWLSSISVATENALHHSAPPGASLPLGKRRRAELGPFHVRRDPEAGLHAVGRSDDPAS